mmetsp:Transcript_29548/g.48760  ORF Transcript_29548/g.48760 Transcript_29548/m.48760 type:complete len:178 (+) Transcript_29548:304-837(+)|eukprot:CAMPEP_0119015404 /NCGR_PEP_ID=MMETSP1176-20130426/10961_1 /TAXON_ID=265551 /ORGANISM="Synedropsis recta cf, Strain CCMP1620" /LENGTH=177 /DNA_ID=CAMNT_0006968695 /DNA_START=302 /DNA_END=835 /DNA_ORIENTATION=+
MGFLKNLTKQILLVAIIFYGLPIFWYTYNGMDDDPESEYFLSVRFLMSTGSLLAFMGMAYVTLPIDFVPDWIPILGKLDDLLAKMTFGGGIMMCYMGYQFGSGEVPREFQVPVTAVRTVHGAVMPVVKEKIVPLIVPAMQAIAVPMKVAAKAVFRIVLQKVQDPETVMNLADKAREL